MLLLVLIFIFKRANVFQQIFPFGIFEVGEGYGVPVKNVEMPG